MIISIAVKEVLLQAITKKLSMINTAIYNYLLMIVHLEGGPAFPLTP
jgi:hypothetical protein